MNIPIELCEHIRERIIPQYVNFDKAHRIDHVEKVIEESMKLALHYEVDSAMVYTVAAYHDLGLCEGREFHHIVSGKILLADEIAVNSKSPVMLFKSIPDFFYGQIKTVIVRNRQKLRCWFFR